MGYTFIDHTADVAANLTGRTVGELFVSAARALTDTISDIDSVRPVLTESVALDADSVEDLLVDWLNELLYRFEVHDVLLSDAMAAGIATSPKRCLRPTKTKTCPTS
jgi:SHS2 domain-containing protein